MDIMSALWRVSLMLALNRSLLNREYVLINALKALVSIVFTSKCSFQKKRANELDEAG
jgi:hypothetical protein